MNDPQRSKAAAMFGKTFMDAAKPTPPAKNYATAQQKVANSRPIPTYKVGGPVKKAMGGEARQFDEAVAAMPTPVMRAVGGAGKTRKGQAPIKRAMGGPVKPVKDGSKKDAEYGDYVAGEKDRRASKPVKKAEGGKIEKRDAYLGEAFRGGMNRAEGLRGLKGKSPVEGQSDKEWNDSIERKAKKIEREFLASTNKPRKGGPPKVSSDEIMGSMDLRRVPVKKAMGGVGKMRHDVPMKGVKPHKGIGV